MAEFYMYTKEGSQKNNKNREGKNRYFEIGNRSKDLIFFRGKKER